MTCPAVGASAHPIPEVAAAVDAFLEVLHDHRTAALLYVTHAEGATFYRHVCDDCTDLASSRVIRLSLQANELLRLMGDEVQSPTTPAGESLDVGWRPAAGDHLRAVEAWVAGRTFRRRFGQTPWPPQIHARTYLHLGVFTQADADIGLAQEWVRGWMHEGTKRAGRWRLDDAAPLALVAFAAFNRTQPRRANWSEVDVRKSRQGPVLSDVERDGWCIAAAIGRETHGPVPGQMTGATIHMIAANMFHVYETHTTREAPPRWGESTPEPLIKSWYAAATALADRLRKTYVGPEVRPPDGEQAEPGPGYDS